MDEQVDESEKTGLDWWRRHGCYQACAASGAYQDDCSREAESQMSISHGTVRAQWGRSLSMSTGICCLSCIIQPTVTCRHLWMNFTFLGDSTSPENLVCRAVSIPFGIPFVLCPSRKLRALEVQKAPSSSSPKCKHTSSQKQNRSRTQELS